MRVYEYKGSWYYTIDVDKHPVTGKRRQVKKGGFKSEREAERAAIKAKVEFEKGNGAPTEKITFGEVAEMWFDEYKNSGFVKNRTVQIREHSLRIILSHVNHVQLKKLTMNILQNTINQVAEKYAQNTTREILTVIKMITKKAKQYGFINADPCEFVYIPKKRKSLEEIEKQTVENKYLDKNTLKKFLDIAKDYGLDYDYLLFRLMAYTGMRVGEIMALKWSDINFEESAITINRRITHINSNTLKFELDTPKTESSKRTITVDQKIITSLKELRTQQHWFRSKHPETVDLDFVFINMNTHKGYPITNKNVTLRLNRIKRMAGITQHITPHTFRHTHTSLMAEAGVNLETIMERLGHKNDSITREIYLHITKSLKQEAVEKFARLMNDE